MEILDLINEKNEVLGQVSRQEVREKGLLYRSAQIVVFYNGKIVLEIRSKNKSKRPLHLSDVGETVQAGETFEEAAVRGVKEEIGLDAENLKEIGEEIINDGESNDNFLARYFICEGKGEIKIQEEELESVELVEEEKLSEFVASHEKVSPSLLVAIKFLKENKK